MVDVEGVIVVTKDKIESTTQQNVELQIKKILIVSQSTPNLPLQLEDASRPASVLKAQVCYIYIFIIFINIIFIY